MFTNAVFAVMLGQNARHLVISKAHSDLLGSQLYSLDLSLIPPVLKQTVDRLIVQLAISDADLIVYIRSAEDTLLHRLLPALQNHSLDKLVITDHPIPQPSVTLLQPEPMQDADFRHLLHQLSQSDDSQAKAALIMGQVRTFSDFIDVLEADCLVSQDYQVLFECLGDLELAMLARLVVDIFGEDDTPLVQQISSSSSGKEWSSQLVLYLASINRERLKTIQQLASQLA